MSAYIWYGMVKREVGKCDCKVKKYSICTYMTHGVMCSFSECMLTVNKIQNGMEDLTM